MEYNERVKSLLIVETFRHWRGIFRVFFPFCINRYAISTKHSAVSITNTTSDYICYTLIILAAPFYMLPKWLFNRFKYCLSFKPFGNMLNLSLDGITWNSLELMNLKRIQLTFRTNFIFTHWLHASPFAKFIQNS